MATKSKPSEAPKSKTSMAPKSKTAWMMRNTDALVQTILASSIVPDGTAVSSTPGFSTLCSYNWLNDGSAILVPGGPPQWKPPPLPTTLRQDTGHQFVDQNAFRVPKFPFEPAFQAISIMNPDIQLDDVDIVVNRNSLRKLLDFAAGRRQDPFRMDLHMVKNTLFISRREKNARQMIHGQSNSGYGHSFEKAFTKPQAGLSQSSSHHRVVRYHIGSLDCVVRFEVDACYQDSQPRDPVPSAETRIDDIATLLADLSMEKPKVPAVPRGGTKVLLKGKNVPSDTLAELKANRVERIGQAIPQLWFGRTPYLITGKHVEGAFHAVSCVRVADNFVSWEARQQEALRKVVSVIRDLKGIVSGIDGKAAILICQEKGAPLTVYSMKMSDAVLPQSIMDKHWGGGSSKG